MKSPDADSFFGPLSKRLKVPVTVYLTGAVAGSIFGNVRSSADIDFAIQPKRESQSAWEEIDAAIRHTSTETEISVQYAGDIDRWGMISLLDYRKTSIPYKKYGSIDVRTLDPVYWAIGKFSRHLEQDREDLIAVFQKQKIKTAKLAKTLGRALKASPPSSQGFAFRREVERFFERQGAQIWGEKFDPAPAITLFRRAAGIKVKP